MARPPFKSTSFSFAQSSYHAGPGSSVSMISPTTTTSVSFGTTPTFSSSAVNKKTITLATTSCAPPPYSSPGDALELLERLARRAAANPADRGGPADILLVAEAFIGGYPRGSTFGAAVGQRSAEGREEWLRYWNCAVDLGEDERGQDFFRDLEEEDDGSGMAEKTVDKSARRGDGTRETLERIARDTGVFLVVGMIEKDGGSLYCSVAYVESRRGIIGRRRKVMPVRSRPHAKVTDSTQPVRFLLTPSPETRPVQSASSGRRAVLQRCVPCPP